MAADYISRSPDRNGGGPSTRVGGDTGANDSGMPDRYRFHVCITAPAIVSRKRGSSLTAAARTIVKPTSRQTVAAS